MSTKQRTDAARAGSDGFAGKALDFVSSKAVVLFFVILCVLAVYFSKLPVRFVITMLATRLTRNLFLVLALIIPVIAGMGLNFSIVVGAMSAQAAIIWVTHWKIGGLGGMAVCVLIATPLAVLLGILIGRLLNKTKGQEMIASMILGFFADGIYQLVFLFLTGKIIPMKNETLILSTGVGVKNTIDLTGGLKYSLDGVLAVGFFTGVFILLGCVAAYCLYRFLCDAVKRKGKDSILKKSSALRLILAAAALILCAALRFAAPGLGSIRVPLLTTAVIAVLYIFNGFILKTKLGQEFRAVGQDMHIAKAVGIDVNRIRVTAIVFSTVLAAWGQLIFLQNMGTINTYGSHTQVGFFAVGALLIGGAGVSKAKSSQALIGVLLFHTLFIASPIAGKNLFGEPQIGEYFRVFVTYGVIGLSIALHAWGRQRELRLQLSERMES